MSHFSASSQRGQSLHWCYLTATGTCPALGRKRRDWGAAQSLNTYLAAQGHGFHPQYCKSQVKVKRRQECGKEIESKWRGEREGPLEIHDSTHQKSIFPIILTHANNMVEKSRSCSSERVKEFSTYSTQREVLMVQCQMHPPGCWKRFSLPNQSGLCQETFIQSPRSASRLV